MSQSKNVCGVTDGGKGSALKSVQSLSLLARATGKGFGAFQRKGGNSCT